jgi:hypothetical protein
MPTGKQPICEESNLQQWKTFILNFEKDHKIKEVSITGGEPTLKSYLPELINWLLSRKYHVILYTNLFDAIILQQVKVSYRFKVVATFHHKDNPIQFLRQYQYLSSRYNVDVDEIEDGLPKRFSFSKLKSQYGKEYLKSNGIGYRISPDGTLFNNCWNMFLNYCENI